MPGPPPNISIFVKRKEKKEVPVEEKKEVPVEEKKEEIIHHLVIPSNLEEPIKEVDKFVQLTAKQKEELIDKLEDQKFSLKKQYKESSDEETKKAVKKSYDEVRELLAKVKACDVQEKVKIVRLKNTKIDKEIKTTMKRLQVSDFNRIIDLTAPKSARKPDESTEKIWRRSKDVIFKGKKYRDAPQEKIDKFNKKMQLKKMPSSLQSKINANLSGNIQAMYVHSVGHDATKRQSYDPLNYHGNYIY